MKLRKIAGRPETKLLQLQILKLCNKKNPRSFAVGLKEMKINLDKILDVIYKYHINDKKILFVGFPISYNEILKNTKHILVPEFVWLNGMLSNRTSFMSNSLKKNSKSVFRLMLKLKKKLDLIVVYNLNEIFTAVREGYLTRVPVITLSKRLDTFTFKTAYNSTGNYNLVNEKLENNSLFFSLVKALLNKAKKTKKIRSFKNLSELREVYRKTDKWGSRNVSWKNSITTK